jgi:sugar O-acyltransferase (sialic acid O-acetyltransferase NeuD family)
MILGNNGKKLALLGAGGIASDISAYITDEHGRDEECPYTGILKFVNDEYYKDNNQDIKPLSEFNPDTHALLIAVGTSVERYNILNTIPHNTTFFTYVHHSAYNFNNAAKIGQGTFIAPLCVLITNIEIGNHCHLNVGTVLGHDCKVGDFFTSAPNVNLSGNSTIGNVVYIGTQAVVKQKISICDNVVIGMCAGVTKDITNPGTYIGVPAKKIK